MSKPIVVTVCMIAPPNRGSLQNSAHIFGTQVPGGGAVHSINSDRDNDRPNGRYLPSTKVQRSKMSLFHHDSITSSARVTIPGGTVIPIVLAVLRFIRSSNFVGCSTGRSAGLAPL